MNVLLSRWQFGITITYHFLRRAAAQDRVGFEHPEVDHLAGEQQRAVPVQAASGPNSANSACAARILDCQADLAFRPWAMPRAGWLARCC
jgi:hypothetical protein